MFITEAGKQLINAARAKKGMTIKELAEAMGLKDQNNVINYINGKKKVSLKTAAKISKALDLDPDELEKKIEAR